MSENNNEVSSSVATVYLGQAREVETKNDDTKKDAPLPECLLCCFTIRHYCVTDCGHSNMVCATCALRLRVFSTRKIKQKDGSYLEEHLPPDDQVCPFCKASWKRVLFTPDPNVSFASYSSTQLSKLPADEELQIYFDSDRTKKHFSKMRATYCPLCEHGTNYKRFSSLDLLKQHLDKVHQRYLCEACVDTRRAFLYEHSLYTHSQLIKHFKYGSKASGNDGPTSPHPFCQFCDKAYYSNDELYVHLNTTHSSCSICQAAGSQEYFRDKAALV